MQKPMRPARTGRRIVTIFILFLLFCTFAIYEINHNSSKVVGMLAGPESPSATSSVDDKQTGKYKIVIDPGHGGHDPGAPTISGLEEKAYTLALAQEVYDQLKQDPMFDPYLTRSDDTFVSLDDRAKFSNDLEADAFISIHGNTYDDPEVSGTETYYYSDSSIQLADVIHEHILAANGFKDRGVRYNDLKVLRLNEVPAILTEVGYLSNASDEALLLDHDGQAHIAQGIIDGLEDYFGGQAP
ncbi:N-acetylmuramoyl-L-alanine amidase [Paenibacillus sepulcri]